MALSETSKKIIDKNASLSHAYIYGYSDDGVPIISKNEAVKLSQNNKLYDQPFIRTNYQNFQEFKENHTISSSGFKINPNTGIISDNKSPFIKSMDNDIAIVGKTTKEHSLVTAIKLVKDKMNQFKNDNKDAISVAMIDIKEINLEKQKLSELIQNNATLNDISLSIEKISQIQKSLNDCFLSGGDKQYQIEAMKLLVLEQSTNEKIKTGDISFDWEKANDYLKKLNTQCNSSKNLLDLNSEINNDLKEDYTNFFNIIEKEKISNSEQIINHNNKIYQILFERQIEGDLIGSNSVINIGLDEDYKLALSDHNFLEKCINQMPKILEPEQTEEDYQKIALDLNSDILNHYYLSYDQLPENLLRHAIMTGDKDIQVLNHIETSLNPEEEIKKCYNILFEKANIFEKSLEKALKTKDFPSDELREIRDELADIYTNQIHNLTSELCSNNIKNLNKNQTGVTYQKEIANCLAEFMTQKPKIHGSALSQMIHSLPMLELDKERNFNGVNTSLSKIIVDKFDVNKFEVNNLTVDDADLLQGLLAHKDFNFNNPDHFINNQPIHEYLENHKQDFLLYIEAQKSPQAVKVYKETKDILNQLNNEHGRNDLHMRLESTYMKQKASLFKSMSDYKENFSSYSIETKVYLACIIAMETAVFAMAGIAKFFVGSVAKVKDLEGENKKIPYKMKQNQETGEMEIFMKMEDPVHKGLLVDTKVGIYDNDTKAFVADKTVLDNIQNSFNNNDKKLLDEFIASTGNDAKKNEAGQPIINGKPKQNTGARQAQNKGKEIER